MAFRPRQVGRGEAGREGGQQLPDFSASWGWDLETRFQKFFRGNSGWAGLCQWLVWLSKKRLKIVTLGFHSLALTRPEMDGIRVALLLGSLIPAVSVSHWKPQREWKHPSNLPGLQLASVTILASP